MTTRGAFLAPVLVPLPSCFVNLPRAFIESFVGIRDANLGATILELSWETLDGYVQRVCVGWIGGVMRDSELRNDTFEISAEFARCVGLQEHLLRVPQAFIGVHVVEAVPLAAQVNVEPVTEDDWELIQLHAGLMESEFLRQICVVNDQQVHPIWIHQNVVIRIRVALPLGMEFARLTPNTEVIVAPKERKPVNPNTALDAEFYFEASSPLRVQVAPHGTEVPCCEVWVHPDTFAVLDGALTKQVVDGAVPVAVWKLAEKSNPTSDPMGGTDTAIPSQTALLKCSPLVGYGRVLLSPEIGVTLAAEPTSRIRLRVLRVPEYTPQRIHFKTVGAVGLTSQELVSAINAHDGLILQSGTILSLQSDAGASVHRVFAEVEFAVPPETEELEQQLTDVPTGALQKYTLLGGRKGHSVVVDGVDLQPATTQEAELLQALNEDDRKRQAEKHTLEHLARDAPAYKKLHEAVRPIVFGDENVVRVMLGVKAPGSVLLYGDRGSGKSTILHSIGDELQRDSLSLAQPLHVDCRKLRGLKMESVKAKLTEVFDDALQHAPAAILFDNLDALVPEENETAGAANDQSRRIAEHLISQLQHVRERMWKTTMELNSALKKQLAAIRDAASAGQITDLQSAARSLLKTAGSAMKAKSVVVIAATRSDATVHKTLRSCGLFDRSIQVMAPNAEQRETIIRDVLTIKLTAASKTASGREYTLDPAIDWGLLSSMTEGCSLRDLSNVSDRSLHQFFLRTSRDAVSRDVDDVPRLVQADFTHALEGFQPTALVGVDLFKSAVKWNDVGGLSAVRNILKDTLELPTRYAKLYDQAPIKLPAGLLLYGPPGCGKTLLASAVASECGLNFISVKGPEVLNKYIGASEQAIRDLFARAASAAPSILFLDEFDSIAPRRGADNTGVTDRLVNQLLTFLDGVESRKGVYVLAATSRPDMIDPALLRPGRLDKSLYCGFPTEAERLDILRAVGRNMELAEDALAFLEVIAASPKSRLYSGADLQALMYSAQLELVHEKLGANGSTSNVILKRHVETAFHNAKPSTSEKARREFDAMYASFSKSRNTDFSVAAADATANPEGLQKHIQHQRTALA